uniref:Putative chaperone protein dnaj n=1 Tax=Parasteatoda tepidariorum TaxID=114398 RepID=A0A2L2Y887_PARTP
MADHYKVLGVSSTASREELKSCYHNLVREHHPDKSSSQDGSNFCQIQEAWEVLSDDNRRRQYDAEIKAAELKTVHPVQEEVSLHEMLFDQDLKQYQKSCRCGGSYVFDESDVCEQYLLVDCDNCSLSIVVDCIHKSS